MNFKEYYINGNKWTVYINYRNKNYKISIEYWWNKLMYKLFLFTTMLYVIEEEDEYFSVYRKYYFSTIFIGKWVYKKDAIEYIKRLKRERSK